MFPPELAIHICSFLEPQVDKRVLLNCALVDSTWLAAAQPVIFRDLTLFFTSPRHEDHEFLSAQSIRANENLLEALDVHPHLASHIQRVRLKNLEYVGPRGGQPATWVNENQSVARVLGRLTNVRSLTLFRVGYYTVLPSLQEAIQNLFRLNSITSLDLAYVNFASFSQFIGMVSSSTSLTHVTLTSLNCVETAVPETLEHDVISANPPPRSVSVVHFQLALIQIAPFISCFASSRCPFDFSRLEKLRLYELREVDGSSITELVRLVGNRLKVLEIEGSTPIPGHCDGLIDLVPALRTLTIGVDQTKTYSPVSWVKSLLFSSASKPSNVESVIIRLNALDLRTALNSPTFGAWSSVDSLLADPSRFPALKIGAIDIPEDSAVPLHVIEEHFPLLAGTGRLRTEKRLEGATSTWPKIRTWR